MKHVSFLEAEKIKNRGMNGRGGSFFRLLAFSRPYLPLIILALVFSLVQAFAALIIPVFIGLAIDNIVGVNNVNFEAVFRYIIYILISISTAVILQWIAAALINTAAHNTVRDLRTSLFTKLNLVPISFIDSSSGGDLMTRVTADTEQISDGLVHGATNMFAGVLTAGGTLTLMFYINWQIALIIALITPLSIFISFLIARSCKQKFTRQANFRGKVAGLAEEYIGNQKLVLSYDYTKRAEQKFDVFNNQLKDIGTKATFHSSLVNPSARLVNNTVYALAALIGAFFIVKGSYGLTVGTLAIILAYANQYARPFNEITAIVTELQTASAGAKRVFDILDTCEELSDKNLPSFSSAKLALTSPFTVSAEGAGVQTSGAKGSAGAAGECGLSSIESGAGAAGECTLSAGESGAGAAGECGLSAGESGAGAAGECGLSAGESGAGAADECGLSVGESGAGAAGDARCVGEVCARNVDFSYTDSPLIRDFNLSVKSGQRIAIVGRTGSGKTTIINLLMRFYDPSSGSILVDGVDINDITRSSLRSCYGMVLQESWLFKGSIRDNIAYGKADATDEEIIEAAKAADIHSYISRLENGYDTILGESGGALSQGQMQLMCIARVMLRIPPMLILDEATSSIDTRTEAIIQSAFNRMMEGRTSFIIAHRLSTIRQADVILVLDGGNIIEKGTHDELIASGGFYHNLYNAQFDH